MKYFISFLIIALAVGASIGLYSTSPKTKRAKPSRPVPVVQAIEVSKGRHDIHVEAFGTIVPAKKITLQSEVEGRIIEQSPDLVSGGLIREGTTVIKVDPDDYELAVSEYMAELEEARFEFDLEQGKQVIAEREWELMEQDITASDAGKSLALREPHLRLVRARIKKAESKLAAAELALQRTSVRAPFNAIVLDEFVDKGQLVNRQTTLATLAGTDQYWVQVSVPVTALHYIDIPRSHDHQSSQAKIIIDPGNGKETILNGQIVRLLGDLDPDGRMARLIVSIDDPLGLREEHEEITSQKPVLLGSYVKVIINAGHMNNVYTIPREALHEGDVIWIKDSNDRLQLNKVEVKWRRTNDVLASAELKEGDQLITSRLQSPLPGMKVNTIAK